MRALVAAKEAGNAAFKAGNWGEAHRHYSAALSHFEASAGNRAFFAQCFSNRSGHWISRTLNSTCGGIVSISATCTGLQSYRFAPFLCFAERLPMYVLLVLGLPNT